MPMPLDLVVEYTDGTREIHYIPLRIMWGEKENEFTELKRHVEEDWPWVFPEYRLTLDRSPEEILQIEIDPSQRMADVNRDRKSTRLNSSHVAISYAVFC